MRRVGADVAGRITGRRRGFPVARACVAALALLAIGSALGCAPASGARGTARPTTVPIPTATAIPCPPVTAPTSAVERQLAAAVARAVGQDARCLDTAYRQEDRTAAVTVTVGWPVPATDEAASVAQERSKDLCFRAQRALWTSGVALSAATVVVVGSILNTYAELTTGPYASADLRAPTAARFAWASLSADAAWGAYDNVYLRLSYADDS